MSREWASKDAALARARLELGPVWFGRVQVVLVGSAWAEDAEVARARTERARIRRAILALSEEALKDKLLAALEDYEARRRIGAGGWAPVKGPDRSRANRSQIMRVLADSRMPRDPPFPGPTALALFDVGQGLTSPPRDLAGWRRLVATWGTELRKVGLSSETARKRLRVKTHRRAS